MAKYEHTNPLEKLHPEEPYFFLRAQDRLAPNVVHAYADLLFIHGDRKGAEECHEFADRMEAWQRENGDKVKMPD